eukprot:3070214-Prymnesium_polylepis.2
MSPAHPPPTRRSHPQPVSSHSLRVCQPARHSVRSRPMSAHACSCARRLYSLPHSPAVPSIEHLIQWAVGCSAWPPHSHPLNERRPLSIMLTTLSIDATDGRRAIVCSASKCAAAYARSRGPSSTSRAPRSRAPPPRPRSRARGTSTAARSPAQRPSAQPPVRPRPPRCHRPRCRHSQGRQPPLRPQAWCRHPPGMPPGCLPGCLPARLA